MTVRPGEDLENLTEHIFRILTSGREEVEVERNVDLSGADGTRRIDIVMRSSVGPIALTTIIECKDHGRRVDVTKVDALHSVIQDVRASKGVLVARKGFSGGAVNKAKRLGISLLLADRLANLKDFAFDVPIYVREVRQVGVQFEGKLYLEGGTRLERGAFWRLNDVDLIQHLRDELLQNPKLADNPTGRHVWQPMSVGPPWYVRDIEGRKWEFDNLQLSYSLKERHFFGYLRDFETVLYLRDEIENTSTVLLPAEALTFDYSARFCEYDGKGALPVEPKLSAQVVVLPDQEDMVSSDFSLRHLL